MRQSLEMMSDRKYITYFVSNIFYVYARACIFLYLYFYIFNFKFIFLNILIHSLRSFQLVLSLFTSFHSFLKRVLMCACTRVFKYAYMYARVREGGVF